MTTYDNTPNGEALRARDRLAAGLNALDDVVALLDDLSTQLEEEGRQELSDLACELSCDLSRVLGHDLGKLEAELKLLRRSMREGS